MRKHSEFFELVHAELDAERDPLDCTAITGWLAEHPEALEEFANLRAVSLQLASQSLQTQLLKTQPLSMKQPASRRWWRPLAALATAAAAVLFVLRVLPKPVDLAEALPSSGQAQLISLSVSSQQQVETIHFAPADPVTGAVILSMKSTIRETTY